MKWYLIHKLGSFLHQTQCTMAHMTMGKILVSKLLFLNFERNLLNFSDPPPPRMGIRFVWWYDDGGVCAALWWRGWCGDIRSHDLAVTPPPGPYHPCIPPYLFIPYHTRLYFFLPPGHTIQYPMFPYTIIPDCISFIPWTLLWWPSACCIATEVE